MLDLGVIKIINNRITNDMAPQKNDITAEVPGQIGSYYFNTNIKNKVFNIEVAFDNINE
jgi:hypothetical protein